MMYSKTRRHIKKSILAAAIAAGAMPLAARPTNRYWVGANNGNWNTSTNWSASSGGAGGAGVPVAGDNARFDYILSKGQVRSTAFNGGYSSPLNSLFLTAIGGGLMTLTHSTNRTMYATSEVIGYTNSNSLGGRGAYVQSAGNNLISNYLILGDIDSSGTYTLSNTGNLTVFDEYVGLYGSGTFNQSGGNNLIANDLYLGKNENPFLGPDASGTYTLSGGELRVDNNAYIGEAGKGTFTHTAGDSRIELNLILASNAGSQGTYNLSGDGRLDAAWETVGEAGIGTFNHTSGTNTVGILFLAKQPGSSGSYNLSGGTVNASSLSMLNGSATFTQSGGLMNANWCIVGSGGIANYIMTGGTFIASVDGLYVGGSSGSFVQSGGSSAITELFVATSSSSSAGSGGYNLSNGATLAGTRSAYVGYSGMGGFTNSGGTHTAKKLYLGYQTTGIGIYTLSEGGFLSIDEDEFVGHANSGFFNHYDGTHEVGGLLVLGYLAASAGTYTLAAGELTAAELQVGFAGAGLFTQSGGSNTVAADIILAVVPGSSGTYNLEGGTLTTAAITINNGGKFNRTGGTITPGYTVTLNPGGEWNGSAAPAETLASAAAESTSAADEPTATVFNQEGGTINGTLQIDGTFNYNSGTFNGILVNSGIANINAEFTIDAIVNNGTMNIAAGAGVNAGSLSGSGHSIIPAGSSLTVQHLRQSGVTINGQVTIDPDSPDGTSRLQNLTVDGTLDLTDNDMIVDGGSYSAIETLVIQGFNNGDWLGNGIASSEAANDTNFVMALGVVNNSEIGYTEFGGFTDLDGDEILVKHTYYGDADLGGTVNLDDFNQFLFGYNNGAGGPPAIWLNGDFDYNGSINLDDFNQFLFGLQNQGGALVSPELFAALSNFASATGADVDLSTVPEPAMLSAAAVTGLLLRRRRSAKTTANPPSPIC